MLRPRNGMTTDVLTRSASTSSEYVTGWEGEGARDGESPARFHSERWSASGAEMDVRGERSRDTTRISQRTHAREERVARVLRMLRVLSAAAAVTSSLAPRLSAQGAPCSGERADTTDGGRYERCALGIAPAWNGLAVVRGATSERVATLGFFWPGRVAYVFAGNDSAARAATRALGVRRTAAALTDGGGVLLAAAAVRAIRARRTDGTARVLAAAGAVAFAASVPLQFSADGHLSRAVWWSNAALSR